MKVVDLGEPTSFLDHVFWVALNENAKRAKILWIMTEICLDPESLQEQKKNYLVQGNMAQTSLHGFMIWKVLQRNMWSDVASWRTKQPSNCTKLQLHALMTINSNKKNWDLLENCQKYALKLFWYACTWHDSDVLTSYGQWTSFQDQSQMDSRMQQTIGKIDFIRSSHKWLSSTLSCAKHGTAPQTGFVPRLKYMHVFFVGLDWISAGRRPTLMRYHHRLHLWLLSASATCDNQT